MKGVTSLDPTQQQTFLHCLSPRSFHSQPISEVIYFPNSARYKYILQSFLKHHVIPTSASIQEPLLIVAPTHVSHIQASIICSKLHGLETYFRGGEIDYYDLSSNVPTGPTIIVDMFNLRSISVDIEDESVWVDLGATLGEVYHKISEKSMVHRYPGAVCPKLDVIRRNPSRGRFGNLLPKYGLFVDSIIDMVMVDTNGNVLDRQAMGDDLFEAIYRGKTNFAVIVSWKIKLLRVPEIVTGFRLERTLEKGELKIAHQWQYLADDIHEPERS